MGSAGNFSPEWGYLAPAPSFMRTVRVVLIATAVGATAGAAVVLSLVDRPAGGEATAVAAHAIVTSAQAAAAPALPALSVPVAVVTSSPAATPIVATPDVAKAPAVAAAPMVAAVTAPPDCRTACADRAASGRDACRKFRRNRYGARAPSGAGHGGAIRRIANGKRRPRFRHCRDAGHRGGRPSAAEKGQACRSRVSEIEVQSDARVGVRQLVQSTPLSRGRISRLLGESARQYRPGWRASYLLHSGQEKTVRQFQRTVGSPSGRPQRPAALFQSH